MADHLIRVVSLALRHKPEVFSVVVDNSGWTSLSALVSGIESHLPEVTVTQELVRRFVAEQTVERFEIQGDQIRALYGHSLSHVSIGEMKTPPALLFHATRAKLLGRIRSEGLLAKGRNGVHLTGSWDYALTVKETHTKKRQRGVILAVRTADTAFKGVVFYQATKHIWLSPYIPARFLALVPLAPHGPALSAPPETLIPLDNPNNRDILRKRIAELSDDDC